MNINSNICMIDHDRFIKSLGKCYQLHIESSGMSPESMHRRYLENFYKAMVVRIHSRSR